MRSLTEFWVVGRQTAPYPPAPDSGPRPDRTATTQTCRSRGAFSFPKVPPSGKYMPVYPVTNIVVQNQLRFVTEQTDDIAFQSLESVRLGVSSETIQEQRRGVSRGIFGLEV
jgi:hypothetical protein